MMATFVFTVGKKTVKWTYTRSYTTKYLLSKNVRHTHTQVSLEMK